MKEIIWRTDDIERMLRQAGKRVTTPKRAVAAVLTQSDAHLSADEILHRVNVHSPEVSASTVYRILEELEELGVVVHSHLGRTSVYHLAGRLHGHVTCDRCGVTLEVASVLFDQLAYELDKAWGFSLDRHHVALVGTCRQCKTS